MFLCGCPGYSPGYQRFKWDGKPRRETAGGLWQMSPVDELKRVIDLHYTIQLILHMNVRDRNALNNVFKLSIVLQAFLTFV